MLLIVQLQVLNCSRSHAIFQLFLMGLKQITKGRKLTFIAKQIEINDLLACSRPIPKKYFSQLLQLLQTRLFRIPHYFELKTITLSLDLLFSNLISAISNYFSFPI